MLNPRPLALLLLLTACSANTTGERDDHVALPLYDSAAAHVQNGVALFSRGSLTCSGSLVAPNVVLTAAHCVEPELFAFVESGAYREVRLGTTLERFGGLAAALGDGRISAEHVLAVANACNPRVEAALVEVQEQIIEFASRHRFSHFRSWLASLVQLLDADGPEPDHGEANHASMAADGEGNLHLVMALTGSDAVVAQHIIDTEGEAVVNCHFCHEQYIFSREELEALLKTL